MYEVQQVQVTVQQIEGYLDEGLTRKEIAEKIGISMADCREMFKHPQLKGKKPKKQKTVGFVFVDDNSYGSDAGQIQHNHDEEE